MPNAPSACPCGAAVTVPPERHCTAAAPPYCCRLRNEKIPAKYTQREAGWHDSIDADVKGMLAGAAVRGGVRGWWVCLCTALGEAEVTDGGAVFRRQRQAPACLSARLFARPPAAVWLPRCRSFRSPAPPCTAPVPAGKAYRELVALEEGIQEQLDSGAAADPEYWQAVLKRLLLAKAKARLREIHAGGFRV